MGRDFAVQALDEWAHRHQVTLHFIRPGRPVETGYIESFNGRSRDEFLNVHWFLSLADAPRQNVARSRRSCAVCSATSRVSSIHHLR